MGGGCVGGGGGVLHITSVEGIKQKAWGPAILWTK